MIPDPKDVTAQAVASSPMWTPAGEYTLAALERLFTYHPPTKAQQTHYEEIRRAARHFAEVMLAHTPYCPDQTAALRKIREAVMTANAAIALEG